MCKVINFREQEVVKKIAKKNDKDMFELNETMKMLGQQPVLEILKPYETEFQQLLDATRTAFCCGDITIDGIVLNGILLGYLMGKGEI